MVTNSEEVRHINFDISLLPDEYGTQTVYFRDKLFGSIENRDDALYIMHPYMNDPFLIYTRSHLIGSARTMFAKMLMEKSFVDITLDPSQQLNLIYTIHLRDTASKGKPKTLDVHVSADTGGTGFADLLCQLLDIFFDKSERKEIFKHDRVLIFFHPYGMIRVNMDTMFVWDKGDQNTLCQTTGCKMIKLNASDISL